MFTQVSTKPTMTAPMLAQQKQAGSSRVLALPHPAFPHLTAQSRRRSLYALGLALRLVFFFGLVIQGIALWK